MSAKVLLAISPDRRDQLVSVLKSEKLDLSEAGNVGQALKMLDPRESADLVVVDEELPGGGWRPVLDHVLRQGCKTEVLVTSRCGDELLWAEVIQCGAFDLLPEPYDQQEVQRILSHALQSRYMTLFRHDRDEQVSLHAKAS